MNQNGTYSYASPKVKDLLGYEPEEVIDKTPFDIMPPDEPEPEADPFRDIALSQKPFAGLESTCFRKDGRRVVIETNGVPILDASGNFLGYRGIARDISDRKRAEQALKKSHEELHKSLEETVMSLASTTEKRDPYTAGHQQRVDRLACAIARELGLAEKQIEGLHVAAVLHDIGKISLPSAYLAKPTKLSTQEREIIKCHTEVGYEILKNIPFPWPVADVVRQHHELLDGSGYPRGLSEKEILLEAKILAVADVVEAMSSHRPYRPSLGLETALEEIRSGKGIRYHPQSVDACVHLISEKNFKLSGEG
jgi:PAS domain S-box-containing protein/putative nucleotidyltransferase with HDIG domain